MSEVVAVPTREKIQQLEDAILAMPQVYIETAHALSGKVYARTIFIPAGVTVTGATHRKDHVNVLFGDITVWTEGGMRRLTGYHVLPTKAGAKRAGFAHADTYWTTVAYTEETDLEAIEDDLTDEAERLQTRNPALAGAPRVESLEG